MPTAYLKSSGQTPRSSCTLLSVLITENSPFHKELRKLALYGRPYSQNQLGNSKAYESNYNYSTAVIMKTLPAVYKPIQMYSCYMGKGKNTKASDSVPHISQTATRQSQSLPSLFMTKCQNNSVLFHAFL